MDPNVLIATGACVTVFVGTSTLFDAVAKMALLRRGQMGADISLAEGLIRWRLRNGFSAIRWLSSRLMKDARIARSMDFAASSLSDAGRDTTPTALLDIVLAGSFALGVIAGLLARSVIACLAVCACSISLFAMATANRREARKARVMEALPDALSSMSACFDAGFTLLQTFEQVSKEAKKPLSDVFAQSAHVLQVGGNASEALEVLRVGAYSNELSFVAVALDVQHQSGGSMKQVMAAAADAVKGDLALRRMLRVQTAQAKLSARIVSIMPLVLIAVFSVASPGFLTPFFSSAMGMALLVVAVAMQAAGIVLVRHALSVGGLS